MGLAVVNLVVSLIILIILLVWVRFLIAQVATLKAQIELITQKQRAQLVRDAVNKGFTAEDFIDKDTEEIVKMVYLCE